MKDQPHFTQAHIPVADQIRALLQPLNPVLLEIRNESANHKGHAGDNGTGESHFAVEIVSAAFSGKSKIEQHRMVNNLLLPLLKGPIHALALKTTPL